MIGEKFGRLTVDSETEPYVWGAKQFKKYICSCECGRVVTVLRSSLVSGCTKSCGCLRRDLAPKKRKTHGMSRTPEYESWKQMKHRCKQDERPRFEHYGGRGISVCERWGSFENFLSDMGPRPTASHSIDRIDVNGNYEPSNCRWATKKEQQENKRTIRRTEFAGQMRTASEIATLTGIPYYKVYYWVFVQSRHADDLVNLIPS